MRRGIILAGGSGSRLHPATLAVSKQLLPIYDKPMIYYPLAVFMQAGIRDILLITTPRDAGAFHALLGDGSRLGLRITWATQDRPRGIADAFRVGRQFIGDDPVALILGDNLFLGDGLAPVLANAGSSSDDAGIFIYRVSDPGRYGVVEMDAGGRVLGIEEKPRQPRSSWVVTGLYFYPPDVVEIAHNLKPSARGELEITDINNTYRLRGALKALPLDGNLVWLDAGTEAALLQASQLVAAIEERQGVKIACIEEIAWRKGFIDDSDFRRLARDYAGCGYGRYLARLAAEV